MILARPLVWGATGITITRRLLTVLLNIETLTITLLTLAQNMGLMLALTFVYSLLLPVGQRLSVRVQPIVMGLVFGLFALLVMLNPVDLGGGVRFDGRSIVVALACVYGGGLAGLVSAGVVIPVRFAMGGGSAVSIVGSLLTIVALCVWYKRRYAQDGELQPRQLIMLGILVSVAVMVWVFLAAPERGLQAAIAIGVPSLLLNPLTLVLVGKLLSHETQRTALENALRDSEQRFRQIAEVSDELFWIYDPYAKRPLYVSPAYIRIWDRPIEPLYEDFSALLETIHPDDRERIWKELRDPAKQKTTSEVRIVRPDRAVRWVAVRLHPLLDAAGNVQRVVGTAEDITERKLAETQKLELQIERERGKMLREFINAASHDLRTPLTVMGTSLYLLDRTGQPEQKKYLDQLETQVYRMRRLVDDMLTISRLDAEDAGLALEPRALNDFAEEAVQRHMKEATTKGRNLTSNYAAISPWARIDSAQLSHALERIIKNAIAYTSAGDSITVGTLLQGDEAIITISDTGQGIDAQDLPHIFERFYRADKARGITSGGAGLGLSIARRIVELHHGRIEVESVPDEGSTFRVILPAIAADDGAASRQTPQDERRYS